MNTASLQADVLSHVPAGKWASTAQIHDAVSPGQTGVALKRGRARTYRILRGLAHDGHLQVEWISERHARWTKHPNQETITS